MRICGLRVRFGRMLCGDRRRFDAVFMVMMMITTIRDDGHPNRCCESGRGVTGIRVMDVLQKVTDKLQRIVRNRLQLRTESMVVLIYGTRNAPYRIYSRATCPLCTFYDIFLVTVQPCALMIESQPSLVSSSNSHICATHVHHEQCHFES